MNRKDRQDLSDIRSLSEKKECFLTARSTYIYVILRSECGGTR